MKKISLLLIFLLFILMVRGWWVTQVASVNVYKDQSGFKTIVIPKGQNLNQIANRLAEENLIKSAFVFKLLVSQKGLDDKLQAGTFKLSANMTAEEIAQKLIKPAEIWITLIEGWRVEEMAEKLHQELGINKKEFLKLAKEGYMFPDTYLFPTDITARQIVQILRDNFEKKFSTDLRNQLRSKDLTQEQGVILASIVEREARSDQVRTEVASILLKRLKIDMGLNADATLQYILGYQENEKSWWKKHLTAEDKKIDSPYNTYLYRGLPPKPICNPSLSSLQAVANTDSKTPYLYYYHDPKGNSHYAKTLDEHNENVANNP